MSETLTNGVIVPDKGSRDWYADLRSNWLKLDSLLAGGNITVNPAQTEGVLVATITVGGKEYKLYQQDGDVSVKIDPSAENAEYPLVASTSAEANTGSVVMAPAVTVNPSTGAVTATSFKGKLEGNASTATTATKAVQDGAGAVITDTYATKSELGSKADDANVVHKSGTETIVGTKTFSSQIKGNISGTSSNVVVGSDTATTRGYLVDNNLPWYTWEEGSQLIAGRVPLITDFNNLTKPGVYHVVFCVNDGFVYEEKEYKESLNRPSVPNSTTGFRDGILEIKKTRGMNTISTPDRITQKITLLSGNLNASYTNLTYQRVCLNPSSNAWTAWKRVAIDEEVVHTSGNETIAGTKTFSFWQIINMGLNVKWITGHKEQKALHLFGSMNDKWEGLGSVLELHGDDANYGMFTLIAKDKTNTNVKRFVGLPDGSLTWGNANILTDANQIMILKNLTGARIALGAVIDCGTGNGVLVGWFMNTAGAWKLANNKPTGKWRNANNFSLLAEESGIFVKVG